MEQVLLLNATFEPLKVIDWKRAIRLLTLEKVEVLEEYDREIHSVTFAIKLPAVLRLLRYIRYRKKDIKFSRANIYARDNFKCQYCGHGFESQDLTFDHVTPKRYGGKTEKPVKPDWVPFLMITIRARNVPNSWRDYLYWNLELKDT
jgi:hypothetical protein